MFEGQHPLNTPVLILPVALKAQSRKLFREAMEQKLNPMIMEKVLLPPWFQALSHPDRPFVVEFDSNSDNFGMWSLCKSTFVARGNTFIEQRKDFLGSLKRRREATKEIEEPLKKRKNPCSKKKLMLNMTRTWTRKSHAHLLFLWTKNQQQLSVQVSLCKIWRGFGLCFQNPFESPFIMTIQVWRMGGIVPCGSLSSRGLWLQLC